MAKVAVTGGAGFIGSHLVDALTARGDEVLVIDDLSEGTVANLAPDGRHVHFEPLDIRQRDPLRRLLQSWRPQAVAHLAAVASVPRSIAEPAFVHEVNLNGTFNVFEAARLAEVPRVVFASSAAVYGRDPSLPCAEHRSIAPASPYAAHKGAGELLARAYHESWGVETVSLRFFNVFGERQRATSSYSGVISVFIAALREQGFATITGDGLQTRDFVHVADVTLALVAALLGPYPGPQPINVARGESLGIRTLYSLLAAKLSVPDAPEFAPERPGDVRHSTAAIERMRHVLGVIPRVSVADGLAALIEWQSRERA